jgi:alkyl hydroperoxide reductase subunit AhpC
VNCQCCKCCEGCYKDAVNTDFDYKKLGSILPGLDFITNKSKQNTDPTKQKFKFQNWQLENKQWTILFTYDEDVDIGHPDLKQQLEELGKMAKVFGLRETSKKKPKLDEQIKKAQAWRNQKPKPDVELVHDDKDEPQLDVELVLYEKDDVMSIARQLGIQDSTDEIPAPQGHAVLLIAPDSSVRASMLYPLSTGLNFADVLRLMQSVRLTQFKEDNFKVATPANWNGLQDKYKTRVVMQPGMLEQDLPVMKPVMEDEQGMELQKSVAREEYPTQKTELRYVGCTTDVTIKEKKQLIGPLYDYSRNNFKGNTADGGNKQTNYHQQNAGFWSDKNEKCWNICIGKTLPDTDDFDAKMMVPGKREPEKNNFRVWFDDTNTHKWTILFSYPKDFDPVSTTELGEFHSLANKFKSLETRLIGLSCDSFANHKEYTRDIIAASKEEAQKSEMAFPLIFDEDRTFASGSV